MLTSAVARSARAVLLALCAGVLALSLAACGGGGGKDADPAQAVPASAPFYAQLTVRPTGKLKGDVDAGLKKILGTNDPGAEVQKLLQSIGTGHQTVDYKTDIEPWLGSRVGLFFTSFSGSQPSGGVLLASTDNGKAGDFIAKDVGSKAAKRSYNGVDYRVDKGTAEGIVGDYVFAGDERGLRTVVDTIKGDGVKKIATDANYRQAIDQLGTGDAVATAYVSSQALIDAAARSGGLPPNTAAAARQAILQTAGSASAIKIGLSSQAVSIDTITLGLKQSASATQTPGDASAALKELPGDAWLGFGVASSGDKLRKLVQQLTQAAGLTGTNVNGQLTAMQAALGIDLEKDLFSWMGDLGVFARGTTIADIGGAIVVHSSDPAATQRSIAKIRRLVRSLSSSTKVAPLTGVRGAQSGLEITPTGLPFPILVAMAGDKFVVGINSAAVEAALSPSTTVADSASFKRAAAALAGVDPTFFVDIAPIAQLIQGLNPGTDPTLAQAQRYLSRFGAAAAGSKREGTVAKAKLIVTLNG